MKDYSTLKSSKPVKFGFFKQMAIRHHNPENV